MQNIPDSEEFPIDELARRTGLTVRNIRELQGRGLIEPPTLRGRKGFYGATQLGQIALVRKLQERGYALNSIKDLIESWNARGASSSVKLLEDALRERHGEVLSEAEVAALLPEVLEEPYLSRAMDLKLLVERDGERVATDAELVYFGSAFISCGLPMDLLLDELMLLQEEAVRITDLFRSNFQDHVIVPLQSKGISKEGLEELANAIVVLRQTSTRAVAVVVRRALERGALPLAALQRAVPVADGESVAKGTLTPPAKKAGVKAAAAKTAPVAKKGAAPKAPAAKKSAKSTGSKSSS